MNYQIMQTVICDDCMHGHHDVAGHKDCECICHNNPQCFVCGHNLATLDDIKAGSHAECLRVHDREMDDYILDQMITKYGRDAI